MNNTMPIIRAEHITKSFRDGKIATTVLNGIDLTINPGEQIAIVGASGSGKSTLLTILGALGLPTSGEVYLNGVATSTMSDEQRAQLRNQHIGFVYQFHHLLPEFSALENVAMPLLLRSIPAAMAFHEAKELLNKIGLQHRYEHKLAELSGGERQRVAIARALVTKPACLLADEPTGNLDQRTAMDVYQLLLDLNHEFNASLVIVTHDLTIANKMQRVLTIADGRMVNE